MLVTAEPRSEIENMSMKIPSLYIGVGAIVIAARRRHY